jgi:hypothetical protein
MGPHIEKQNDSYICFEQIRSDWDKLQKLRVDVDNNDKVNKITFLSPYNWTERNVSGNSRLSLVIERYGQPDYKTDSEDNVIYGYIYYNEDTEEEYVIEFTVVKKTQNIRSVVLFIK